MGQPKKALTRVEGIGHQSLLPEGVDLDVGRLGYLALETMVVPSAADALHVLANPHGLQGADDGPDIRLLRGAATGFERPALGDVGHEVLVL